MKKDLEYFLNLKYPVIINPISEADGGGYEAFIPQLGRYTCIGDGETIDEALSDLEESRKQNIRELFEAGEVIAEPERDDDFSGKLLIRMPKYLHRLLAEQAKANDISLNQHITSLLSLGYPIAELRASLKEMCDLWKSVVYKYEFAKATAVSLPGSWRVYDPAA